MSFENQPCAQPAPSLDTGSVALILAGGKSSRMGADKAWMTLINGQTLLENALLRFSQCFDSVMLSVADEGSYPMIQAHKIADIYKNCGPMAGLHAFFAKMNVPSVFLSAVDLPFADASLARFLFSQLEEADACVIRRTHGSFEPLFAAYGRKCLPVAEDCLKSGHYSMHSLLNHVNVKIVEEGSLAPYTLDKPLFNMNEPADYHSAWEWLHKDG